MRTWLLLPLLPCLLFGVACGTAPNIIFIFADDLGYDDVGYHNSAILTPNIDSLAEAGVILEQGYVQPICTPSRAAFLTGMYPYHIGRQTSTLSLTQASGLTLDRTLLSDALSELGYATSIVGKWHLGFCNSAYLPTSRGFDTQFGYWGAEQDYYTKKIGSTYDFHDDDTLLANKTIRNTYSMSLYNTEMKNILISHAASSPSQPLFMYLALQSPHQPLEAPSSYLSMYSSSLGTSRRKYSAMVSALDDVIGNLTSTLISTGMYDNTIIVFHGDNGADEDYGGSNSPLRGEKGSVYEGGTRTPAFVYSPLLNSDLMGTSSYELIHVTDWYPTLLKAAGINDTYYATLTSDLDGINQYDYLFGASESGYRTEMVYNIEGSSKTGVYYGAIRLDGWKLIVNSSQASELYDVLTDEDESTDLSDDNPDVVSTMKALFATLATSMVTADTTDSGSANNTDSSGNLITGWCTV